MEQNTNYAYKLKYIENLSFDKVRDLAVNFMCELPKPLQEELYNALNHGVDILLTSHLFGNQSLANPFSGFRFNHQ